MARGNIKVSDEVAVTAVVRGRVTPRCFWRSRSSR